MEQLNKLDKDSLIVLFGSGEMTLNELFSNCPHKTKDESREEYSYSCSHKENPDYCTEHDGNCLASYCPIACCLDDEEDENCPSYDGDKKMSLN